MTRDRLAVAGATVVLGLAAGLAQGGEILYQNDFESGPLGSEWSSNSMLAAEGVFTRFNGRYTNDSTILTLGAVPPPGDGDCGDGGGDSGGDGGGSDGGSGGGRCGWIEYTLEFDLHIIDSWDGNYVDYGPDTFEVRVGGETLFSETFANHHPWQSFRDPDVGRDYLGFSANWMDSIYRDITLSFVVPAEAETFSMKFVGVGLQSLADESWGIDNVEVSYDVVPAPATLSLGGLMLLLGGRRRTR